MTDQLARARARRDPPALGPGPTRKEALSPLRDEGDRPRGGAGEGFPDPSRGSRPQQPDEWGPVLGATVGAASVAIVVGCGYWLVRWLAGQPPIFWTRVAAVAVVVLGFGAIVGGLAGLGRAGRR